MELLIVAGLGVGALVVLFVVFKLVKAMLRMVFVSIVFVALIAVGATWGRPYLVQAWDTLRGTSASSTPPKGSGFPTPATTKDDLSTVQKNAVQRKSVTDELNRQQIDNDPNSRSSRRRTTPQRRRRVSKGTVRTVR